jgi:hypothetical protein
VKYNKFKAAYDDWLNPAERTQTKKTVLKETEDAFVTVYRRFYTGYMKDNPLVTDDDLQSCGFPMHSGGGGGTSVKKPTTQVEMEAETSNPSEVTIHYRDAGSHHLGKPEGVHGMELIYRVRAVDAPPAKDWKELTNSVFSTRPPLKLSIEGGQRTLILEYASRWENTRGEKGPWNDIQWVVIP